MPQFNRSQCRLITTQPFKWTTPPTYNPDGSVLVAGVAGVPLDGVFILLSDEVVTLLKNTLSAAQKTELQGWVTVLWTDEDSNPARPINQRLATWQANGTVPGWAGQVRHVFLRVPANVWNDPTGPVPQQVKDFFQWLYN